MIFVKALSGRTYTVFVDFYQHTVEDVKAKIKEKSGLASGLIFAGKALHNDRTLASYNIQRNQLCTRTRDLEGALYHLKSEEL